MSEFVCPKGKSIIIFGGHEDWVKGMNSKIKGVKIIDRNCPNAAEKLKYADEIWIQHNAISHSLYKKALAVSRGRGVPLHYFSFSSHIKCFEQFVKESGISS